jgi:hypothetical protein
MFGKGLTLGSVTAPARETETPQGAESVTRAYSAPDLHVVGKADELVQGSQVRSPRDTRYWAYSS